MHVNEQNAIIILNKYTHCLILKEADAAVHGGKTANLESHVCAVGNFFKVRSPPVVVVVVFHVNVCVENVAQQLFGRVSASCHQALGSSGLRRKQ